MGEKSTVLETVLRVLSIGLREIFSNMNINMKDLQEIRLRADKPLIVIYNNNEEFVSKSGRFVNDINQAYIVKVNEIKETMEYVSNYSLYAFEEEIRQGYITISGGHRVGICGKAVIDQNRIKTIKYISFINIRLAHEVIGCAKKLSQYIYRDAGNIYNTLIISPPRCGKTTLLRDLIRIVSNGDDPGLLELSTKSLANSTSELHKGMSVGLIDERSEIAASYLGIPQNDIGVRTDVLDGIPKTTGIMMMIRTMSPKVIAIDEIGSKEDIEAIRYGTNCGCRFIATIHGDSMSDLLLKPQIKEMIEEKIFERYVILSNRGKVSSVVHILDKNMNDLF